jgi:predicted HTH domain antitoxin
MIAIKIVNPLAIKQVMTRISIGNASELVMKSIQLFRKRIKKHIAS